LYRFIVVGCAAVVTAATVLILLTQSHPSSVASVVGMGALYPGYQMASHKTRSWIIRDLNKRRHPDLGRLILRVVTNETLVVQLTIAKCLPDLPRRDALLTAQCLLQSENKAAIDATMAFLEVDARVHVPYDPDRSVRENVVAIRAMEESLAEHLR
jgi:hypothetical protein